VYTINKRFSVRLRFLMKRYSINNNGQVIDFEIVHRPAVTRRIHLEINPQGGLQVVAPRRMSRRAIHSALQDRAQRVASFLVDARARQQDLPELHYVDGEHHLFMGQAYTLNIYHHPGKHGLVELSGEQIKLFLPDTGKDTVRSALAGWYRRRANSEFAERLAASCRAAPWTGGNVPDMRLRLMRKTWGSCSSKGRITLNPHLIKAPPKCIDYVVAHEVCHLREHNHGRAFYALQEQLYPAWREAKALLRNKGHIYLHG
jgi:predicted metal-dependent hydrolase